MRSDQKNSVTVHRQDALAMDVSPESGLSVQGPADGVVQVLWRGRMTVLGLTLLAALAALAYLLLATPLYYGGARLFVEQSSPRIISTDKDQILTGSTNYLHTQCSLLTSAPIIATALQAPDLANLKMFEGIEDPVGHLREQIRALVGQRDDIITVSVDSPYPDEAAILINRLVEAYIQYHSNERQSTGSAILQVLRQEKATREQERAQKIQALLEYKRAHPVLSFADDRGNILNQRLAKLSEALTTAQLERMQAEAAYNGARAGLQGKDPATRAALIDALRARGELSTVAMDRDAETMRKEVNDLRVRHLVLQAQYGRQHPTIVGLERYIAELQSKLDDAEERIAEAYLASREQRLEEARQHEQQVLRSLEQQKQAALDLNDQTVELARLETEVEQVDKHLELLDARLKETATVEHTPPLNIRVLEWAKPAEKPYKPAQARTLALAGTLGLMGGAVLALVLGRKNPRLHSPVEVRATLNARVVGIVPHIPRRRRLAGLADCPEAAEAFRTLRTLIYHGVDPDLAKTILITSPADGDGKSTIAHGLATAMWQAGERVLVLDADLRRPVLHRLFRVSDKTGITDVLTGRTPLDAAIVHPAEPGPDILPCGTIPTNPAELLTSQAFAELLETLTRRYHRVLIDSPPTLPFADARILAGRCDLSLLAARAGRTNRDSALHAYQGLLDVGARVFGVVVNDVRSGLRQYYDYYHSNGYSSHSSSGAGNGTDVRLQPCRTRILPHTGTEGQ